MKVFTIFYAPQYVAIEEMADFKWEDLKGKKVLGGRKGGVHISM